MSNIADPTPVQDAAAVSGLLRERAELQREIDGLRAALARLVLAVRDGVNTDRVPELVRDGDAALEWLDAQRQAARAEAIAETWNAATKLLGESIDRMSAEAAAIRTPEPGGGQ